MRLSHKSTVSSADENGNCYSVDIIPSVKTCGTHNVGLDGMCFGICDNTHHDPGDRSRVIAKFPQGRHATGKWADAKLQQARECRLFGHKFNHSVSHAKKILTQVSNDNEDFYFRDMPGTAGKTRCSAEISFVGLQKAELESVATYPFFKCKRVKGELFVFEKKLDNFTRFIDHEGNSVVPPRKGKLRRSSSSSIDEDHHQLLHAFIHFYFCHSSGLKIPCNVRGSYDEASGYVLTTPWIYSQAGNGAHDEGRAGMKKVINNHVCNKYCRHLPNMTELFNSLSL